jgi:hypothetical protein
VKAETTQMKTDTNNLDTSIDRLLQNLFSF